MRAWQELDRRLRAPVDNASLVLFRIAFGVLMGWNTVRYIVAGRIDRYFLDPIFAFKFFGFEWVHAPPAAWLHALFFLKIALCACIALGWRYRTAMTIFFLSFTYTFLLELARYLNHYYLICLLSFLLIFVPANGATALDARREEQHRRTTPAWTIYLLRAQLVIVYFYAGIAKINPDWLQGEPMRMWLHARADLPVIGPLLGTEPTAYLFSYGGLLLDLLVAPLLLWRRTRAYAFCFATVFHVSNATMFGIGVFPWLMIAATTLFFRPDWPRRFLGLQEPHAGHPGQPSTVMGAAPKLALVSYLALQCLIPLRHFLYPGRVSWTEEGHMFAWHMKLRSKRSRLTLLVRDATSGETRRVDPAKELEDWQVRKMTGRPDMILQYAHFLARRERQRTGRTVEVRALTATSLNGRPEQPIINPLVDLVEQRRSLAPANWIVPLADNDR